MNQEIENELMIRDKLIASLKKQVSLQDKIIKKQNETINTLEEQLTKFQMLMKEMLNSQQKGQLYEYFLCICHKS